MKQSLEWWNVNSESNPRVGPRLLGLHPNGLFTLELSPFELQSHLDYTQLDTYDVWTSTY